MKTPLPITFRERWEFSGTRGLFVPTGCGGGHPLTATGAQKGTTADGVHFTGAATSNIVVTAAAGQNAQQAFHITIRFKLDQTFAAGAAADFYLFQKLLAADDYLRVYLENADGKLYWIQGNAAGGVEFTLTSTTVSWTAGTWYTVTVSLTNTPTQRLLVNGTVEDTDTVATPVATPNGGDMVIGSSSDGGTDGVVGTISWVVIGVGATAATALTAAEESDLSKGAPPPTAKVQYMYLMDEGRGVTATDRGSAGGNGTLDTACAWQYGQVQQPVLSLDGINDHGDSSSGVDIGGDITLVLVIKAKTTFAAAVANGFLLQLRIDGNNYLVLLNTPTTIIKWRAVVGGGVSDIDYITSSVIDDYLILVGTVTVAGAQAFYVNGALVNTAAGGGATSHAAATAYFGSEAGAGNFDINKPIYSALIEGALTAAQVKAYSRWLRDRFNLPVSI